MTTDSTARVPPHRHPNLQHLPEVVAVQVHRVRYRRPRRLTVQGKDHQLAEAVEIVVETSEPLPIRALNPVLYVGDTALTVAEGEGERRYRFLAPRPDDLQPGAPIALGWNESGAARQPTRFTYQPPAQPAVER